MTGCRPHIGPLIALRRLGGATPIHIRAGIGKVLVMLQCRESPALCASPKN
jgi:hypothetical protein